MERQPDPAARASLGKCFSGRQAPRRRLRLRTRRRNGASERIARGPVGNHGRAEACQDQDRAGECGRECAGGGASCFGHGPVQPGIGMGARQINRSRRAVAEPGAAWTPLCTHHRQTARGSWRPRGVRAAGHGNRPPSGTKVTDRSVHPASPIVDCGSSFTSPATLP